MLHGTIYREGPHGMISTVYSVSRDDIAAFHRDGVIVLRGVVGERWLARLSNATDRDIAAPGPYYHGYGPEEAEKAGPATADLVPAPGGFAILARDPANRRGTRGGGVR